MVNETLLIPGTVYHGSEKRGLRLLTREYSHPGQPFGPAIYCSGSSNTAAKYTSSSGSVYVTSMRGSPEGAMHMNEPLSQAPTGVKSALDSMMKRFRVFGPAGMDTPIALYNQARMMLRNRDCRHPETALNLHLQDCGFWLLYGEIAPEARSGSMDFGIQYAVLDWKTVSIEKELVFPEFFSDTGII